MLVLKEPMLPTITRCLIAHCCAHLMNRAFTSVIKAQGAISKDSSAKRSVLIKYEQSTSDSYLAQQGYLYY